LFVFVSNLSRLKQNVETCLSVGKKSLTLRTRGTRFSLSKASHPRPGIVVGGLRPCRIIVGSRKCLISCAPATPVWLLLPCLAAGARRFYPPPADSAPSPRPASSFRLGGASPAPPHQVGRFARARHRGSFGIWAPSNVPSKCINAPPVSAVLGGWGVCGKGFK